MEITEEEEEEQRETKRQSVVEEVEEETKSGEIGQDQPRPHTPITDPPVTLDSNLASSPQESQFAGTAEPPSFIGVPRPASPAKSFDDARRMSSQSSRQDYYSHSSYLYSKPRVKLGPRPSVDPSGRPRSSAGNTVRPVASMPAGLKLSLKGAKKGKHDDSSSVISEEHSDDAFLTPSLSIAEDTSRPHTSGGRPNTSSGASVKSLPAVSTPAKHILTPEKLRLMKAMQLREKKKRASEMQATPVPSVHITASPAVQVDEESQTTAAVPETQETMLNPADTECEPAADQVSKADSGIDVASSAPTDQGSVRTQTDSRPTSPIGASSEVGDSTQASSVSESTDETVHPAQEDKRTTEESETPVPSDEPTVGIPPSGADVEDTPNAQGSDAPEPEPEPEAVLTQPGSLSEPNIAEADETRDDQDTKQVEKLTPVEEVTPSESSLIPTSKFAAKVASGQAATDPMASRDADPPNVTSVPERIDEVEPALVGPSERTEDGPAASPTKWNLPISKYSTHDSSKCLAPSPILENVASSTTSPHGQDNLANAANKMDDEIASGEKGRSDSKRRPEPILTGSDLPNKEATREGDKKSTDDAQSTTIEEARSITVTSPKSPVTTIPAAQPNEQPTPRILRTVSSPTGSPRTNAGDPPPSASRSVSGSAFQNRMSQPPGSGHLAPRGSVKVGTGISSRIKAFEQIAAKSGPVAPVVPVSSKDRPSSAFFSVRQNSIRDGARSPSVLDRANSIYRGRTPTPNESLDGSPETVRSSRERSGSVVSRMSVFEGGNAPRGRPETVSVTARIVRDPGQAYSRPASQVDFSDFSPLDLKQSPLIVDHQKALEEREAAPVPAADAPPVPTPLVHAGEPRRSLQERRLSKDTKASSVDDPLHRPGQRTSLTMARDFIRESMVGKDNGSAGRPPSVHLHQPSSFMSRLSISTRHKSITPETALQSPTSAGEKDELGDEKKEGNRASRIMRRLSSTFSPKKTSPATTSPTLPEEGFVETEKANPPRSMTAPAAPAAGTMVACMGDVNVQFPENLLWKRRSMSLDSNGFLHLTPAQGAVSAREKQSKRFHMSEFKSPYAPEIEVQELPNSVCLDFLSGSGLQFAFQDRAGQLNGLQSKHYSVPMRQRECN